MNVILSENLKILRKAKGNTQEDLASFLGISTQAVSKWERGEGLPDITLLPSLASYYETTVDYLLGCDTIKSNKKLAEYMAKYKINANNGKIEENILLMREALHEFPNNLDIMANLMHSLFFVDKDEYLDEGISLGEKILQKSTCDKQRYSVIQSLVYSYSRKHMIEKAKEYAHRLPNTFCTQNMVLEAVLKGEELQKLTQGNIIVAISAIDSAVTWMLRSKEYTPQEKIFAYETVVNVYQLFLYDGNYGYEHSALQLLWMNIAKESAKLQNTKKTLAALNEAHIHAKALDSLIDGKYTSLFTDQGEYSKEGISRNFQHSYVDWLRSIMKNKVFDFLRDSVDFKSITDDFSKTSC